MRPPAADPLLPDTSTSSISTPADPTYRLGSLPGAAVPPICVAPDDPLHKATTLLLARDFSQLPVVAGRATIKGIISWKSIGRRVALGQPCALVRDCTDPAHTLRASASLFDAIPIIIRHDSVVVLADDNRPQGIVTTADLSQQFRLMAEPFLLLGEIETHLRRLLGARLSLEQLRACKDPRHNTKTVESVHDLTLGECSHALQSAATFAALRLPVDHSTLLIELETVGRIRNDVMHFSPDGIGDAPTARLRAFASFIRTLTHTA